MRTLPAVVLFLTCVFMVFPSIPALSGPDTSGFRFSGEEDGYAVQVKTGEPFTVVLEGEAWYLNRYDRNILSFESRTAERTSTSFIIRPKKVGEGFLLFSRLFQNIRVSVAVYGPDFIPEQERGAMSADEETVVEETGPDTEIPPVTGEEDRTDTTREAAADAAAVAVEPAAESKAAAAAAAAEEEEEARKAAPAPKKEKTKKKPDGLFYIDDDGKRVSVAAGNEDELYKRGLKLYRNGKKDLAATVLERYTDSCKKCRYLNEALLLRADSAVSAGKREEALTLLERVESGEPPFAGQALIKKAEILYEAGRIKEAGEAYRRAYETSDHDTGMLEKMGDIQYMLEDYKEALEIYEEGIEKGLQNDRVIFRVATFYDRPGVLRNIERAYHYYKIITERYTSSVHYDEAARRVRFFEKNFFNYK